MVFSNMLMQISFCISSIGTEPTCKWLFTSMNSNMCDNVIFSPKFFVAVCTIVRFRSKLDPLEQKYKQHLKFESNFENHAYHQKCN